MSSNSILRRDALDIYWGSITHTSQIWECWPTWSRYYYLLISCVNNDDNDVVDTSSPALRIAIKEAAIAALPLAVITTFLGSMPSIPLRIRRSSAIAFPENNDCSYYQ